MLEAVWRVDGAGWSVNRSDGSVTKCMRVHDDSNSKREITNSSFPIFVQAKYLFGSPNIRAYLMGGVGIQFSNIEFSGTNLTT